MTSKLMDFDFSIMACSSSSSPSLPFFLPPSRLLQYFLRTPILPILLFNFLQYCLLFLPSFSSSLHLLSALFFVSLSSVLCNSLIYIFLLSLSWSCLCLVSFFYHLFFPFFLSSFVSSPHPSFSLFLVLVIFYFDYLISFVLVSILSHFYHLSLLFLSSSALSVPPSLPLLSSFLPSPFPLLSSTSLSSPLLCTSSSASSLPRRVASYSGHLISVSLQFMFTAALR